MKLRTRILIAFTLVILCGAALMVGSILEDVKARYREAVEESLNDSATILSSLVAMECRDGALRTKQLSLTISNSLRRRIDARVYSYTKVRVDLRVYVTNVKGRVVYDSQGGAWVGKDFSRWNDVLKTLRGGYGARTTRANPDDPRTSVMYVASPIRVGDKLVGVLTVCKPVHSVMHFMAAAQQRLLASVATGLVALFVLAASITVWVTQPLGRLTEYARSIRDDRRATLPDLGKGEIAMLGRALEEMRDALEGKQYVEHYVQTLTHEMKSPLAAIAGAAELLEEEMPVVDRTRFLANIRGETSRLQNVVERLLLLASIENRKGLRDVETIRCGPLLEDVATSGAPKARARRITVEQKAAVELDVVGERFLVRHALANLLDNALDFCPEEGRVTLDVARDGELIVFAIEDEGEGVPDYAKDKVFERFYSLERPGTGRKSSGLGLAFVHEVAVLHGGEASLETRSGGGTRAILALPVTPMEKKEKS